MCDDAADGKYMAAGVQLEERKLRPLLLQLLALQLLLAAASKASDGTRITCNDISAPEGWIAARQTMRRSEALGKCQWVVTSLLELSMVTLDNEFRYCRRE